MCYRMKSLVIVYVCVCMSGLFLGTSAVNADLVNGSFELPALDPNQYQAGPANNWEQWNAFCYVINGNNASGDGFAGPADGNQFQEYLGWIGQNTGIPLVHGYTYEVSCQANRGGLTGWNYFEIELNAADSAEPGAHNTRFSTQQYTDLTASTWVEKTHSATYTGSPDKYLSVWFKMDGAYGGLDAVSVTIITPEPSAMLLMATGMIGLLACAWRKRK